ncbi:MAG: amidohydrolase [Actinomycetota bacterium]|nr:amidohydrolase [Actinomycetota bacterium]
MRIDIHQHLWPLEFLDALRARRHPPRLDGWTLVLFGGDRWDVDPTLHDPARRVSDHELICLAPSAALGIDRLPPGEAVELAEAWLTGVLALGDPFRAWATAGVLEANPAALLDALDRGAIGLEVAADTLSAPDGLDRLAPLLDALRDRPLLVHPGPTAGQEAQRPGWWTPTVSYVNQLHAAWWAWADGGRTRFPDLPVCFVALAGLGPLHGERQRARGGAGGAVDPLTFVETSSYGTQAVDAVLRVLGVDVICHGSDRPYATPAPLGLDAAALYALQYRNPARLCAQTIKEVPV